MFQQNLFKRSICSLFLLFLGFGSFIYAPITSAQAIPAKYSLLKNKDDLRARGYNCSEVLGSGSYGAVYKCTDLSGKIFAIKVQELSDTDGPTPAPLRELAVLEKARGSRNLLQLENYFIKDQMLYLVLEYLPLDLKKYLEQQVYGHRKMSEDLFKNLVAQIVNGLNEMKQLDLAHRDLKPANILVDCSGADPKVKIADFGMVRQLQGGEHMPTPADEYASLSRKTLLSVGYPESTPYNICTRWYRAPEILLGSNNYGQEADLWSLGCILSEMSNGRYLFPGDSDVDQLEKIYKQIGTPNNLSAALDPDLHPELLALAVKNGHSARYRIYPSAPWRSDFKIVNIDAIGQRDFMNFIANFFVGDPGERSKWDYDKMSMHPFMFGYLLPKSDTIFAPVPLDRPNLPIFTLSSRDRVSKDKMADYKRIVMDWLLLIGKKFKSNPMTLHFAKIIIDEFLQKQEIPHSKLKLLGISAFQVASTYVNNNSEVPRTRDLSTVAAYTFSVAEIDKFTQNLLKVIPSVFPTLDSAYLKLSRQKHAVDLPYDQQVLATTQLILTIMLHENTTALSQEELWKSALTLAGLVHGQSLLPLTSGERPRFDILVSALKDYYAWIKERKEVSIDFTPGVLDVYKSSSIPAVLNGELLFTQLEDFVKALP